MKKPTDFAYILSKFFGEYLTVLCNFSENTICSYRDTFKLFLSFCICSEGIPSEKLCFKDIDADMIERFLRWLKSERNSSVSTCNQRLAALHAFFKYVQYEHPELFPEKISPHCLRHSKAMHLLQSGVNLIYIGDFLGHTDVKTTQIYARADVTLKRKAIETASIIDVAKSVKSWTDDEDLVSWLNSLGKQTD